MGIPRRRKKSRKMRGSRLHGYGLQRQHRRSGRRGGFGKAGGHKHLWTWYTTYWPDYFGRGRRGLKRPRAVVREVLGINVGELEKRLSELEQMSAVVRREDGTIEIDLTKTPYERVLGRGTVSMPLIVKAHRFTEKAAAKIESAGGKAVPVEGVGE